MHLSPLALPPPPPPSGLQGHLCTFGKRGRCAAQRTTALRRGAVRGGCVHTSGCGDVAAGGCADGTRAGGGPPSGVG